MRVRGRVEQLFRCNLLPQNHGLKGDGQDFVGVWTKVLNLDRYDIEEVRR